MTLDAQAAAMSGLTTAIADIYAVAHALAYVCLKAVGLKAAPSLLLACVPRRGGYIRAVCWILLSVAAVCVTHALAPFPVRALAVGALTLLYLSLACASMYGLVLLVRRDALRLDALFLVSIALFVGLPAPLLRMAGAPEYLLVGWYYVLAAYSYAKDGDAPSNRLSLRGFLFFVMVDPTVCVPRRSVPASTSGRQVLKRLLLGTCLLIAGQQLLATWRHHPDVERFALELEPSAELVLTGLVVFFASYWMRAGCAHVQIGLMNSLGYRTPECFDHPYLASSPTDFWRRWNLWIAEWVRRYLFAPLALTFQRIASRRRVRGGGRAAQVASVVLSFTGMGLLHDLPIFCNLGQTSFVYTRTFVTAAVGVLIWEGGAAALRAVRASRTTGALTGRGLLVVYVASLLMVAGKI